MDEEVNREDLKRFDAIMGIDPEGPILGLPTDKQITAALLSALHALRRKDAQDIGLAALRLEKFVMLLRRDQ